MIYSVEVAEKTAEYLLQIKAIKLQPHNPFTWSSGWKSPIYCDNRMVLSHSAIRTFVKEKLSELVLEKFKNTDLIAGVATAGIAMGALLADQLNLPYAYVRPEPKKHGLSKQIEGEVKAGQRAVIVEDLFSTGGSSINTLPPLRDAGCEINGAVAIFDYGFEISKRSFEQAACPYYSLSNYNHLLLVALKQNYISSNDMEILGSWRNAPESWGK